MQMKIKFSIHAASFVPWGRNWFLLSEYHDHHRQKKKKKKKEKDEPVSLKMHSKISRLGGHLEFSNFKFGCMIAVLHLLLNYRPPIAPFCSSADEIRCAFQFFTPFLTLVLLLETLERLFRIVTLLADIKNRPSEHLWSLWLSLFCSVAFNVDVSLYNCSITTYPWCFKNFQKPKQLQFFAIMWRERRMTK